MNYGPVLLMIALGFMLHMIPAKLSATIRDRIECMPLTANLVFFMIFVVTYAYFKTSEPIMPIYLRF